MLNTLIKYKYSVLYVLSIMAVTLLFLHYPMIIHITETAVVSPWSVFVGTWFVLRDFSQRELGDRKVFIPMAVGVAFAVLASPAYAIATCLSSVSSELADWAVYTYTKKPFHKRILVSSLVSAPVDSLVFLLAFDFFDVIPGISLFSWASVVLVSTAKILVALVVMYYYSKNEKQISKKPKKVNA